MNSASLGPLSHAAQGGQDDGAHTAQHEVSFAIMFLLRLVGFE